MDAGGHDIPHPIGDPDDDDGGLVEDDDEEEDDDDEDEEPMQVRRGHAGGVVLQCSTRSAFLV